jgi:hypothetical protein
MGALAALIGAKHAAIEVSRQADDIGRAQLAGRLAAPAHREAGQAQAVSILVDDDSLVDEGANSLIRQRAPGRIACLTPASGPWLGGPRPAQRVARWR